MRRALESAGAALILLMVTLTGCGQGTNTSDPATDATSNSQEETSSTISGTVVVLAAASLTESFTELGAIFEAAHPGSTVSFSFTLTRRDTPGSDMVTP